MYVLGLALSHMFPEEIRNGSIHYASLYEGSQITSLSELADINSVRIATELTLNPNLDCPAKSQSGKICEQSDWKMTPEEMAENMALNQLSIPIKKNVTPSAIPKNKGFNEILFACETVMEAAKNNESVIRKFNADTENMNATHATKSPISTS
jgi:hypothetical protein